MSSSIFWRRIGAWFAPSALALLALGASSAWAQQDPPGRVGRLAELQGTVSWYDHEQGNWVDAERNRPLTGGDRLSTGPQGRAEVRVGSTVLRLGAGTELEVLRLDDERMVFQLHSGSLALRVRSREVASDIEVDTAEIRLRPERSGHYRIDRIDDTTQAGVWRGTLRLDDAQGFILETGQRAELWRERGSLKFNWGNLPGDAFAEWVQRDDQRDDQRTAASRYVSPEMTGAEDLDRAGRWERHPEYGAIWYPYEVQAGWAPYRYGRWAWVSPWGWTWVDEASWGFAPFHYGRWVNWGGRWGWCPGEYVARPIYAPALVAWIGGPGVGVSINLGGPMIGWVPLAPREWYTPYYRHTPVYGDRMNPRPPGHRGEWQRPTVQAGVTVTFSNQNVQGGVTIVGRDALARREPVGRVAIDSVEVHRAFGRQPVQIQSAPVREAPPQIGPQAPRVQPGQPVSRPAFNGPDRPERPDRRDRGERGDRGDRDRAPPVVVQPPAATAAPATPVAPAAPVQVAPQRPAPGPAAQPAPPPQRQPGQIPQPAREREGPGPQRPAAAPPAQAPAAAPAAAVPPRPATPQAQPAPAAAPAAVGPQAPRRGPAEDKAAREREEERKRGPENRGQRNEREDKR